MSLSESAFETIASDVLEVLADQLDDMIGEESDVELNAGILTVTTPDGSQFILNKHGPNRQIWVSSPVSGASHYDPNEDGSVWTAARDGADLLTLLAHDLSLKTGQAVTLAL